jgi:hypothetical protein
VEAVVDEAVVEATVERCSGESGREGCMCNGHAGEAGSAEMRAASHAAEMHAASHAAVHATSHSAAMPAAAMPAATASSEHR